MRTVTIEVRRTCKGDRRVPAHAIISMDDEFEVSVKTNGKVQSITDSKVELCWRKHHGFPNATTNVVHAPDNIRIQWYIF